MQFRFPSRFLPSSVSSFERARAAAGAGQVAASWRSLLVAAALALAACKGSASTSSSAEGGAGSEIAEQQLTTKLNIYVACLNKMNPAVHYSRERYLG